MLLGLIMNYAAGAGLKIFSTVVGTIMENRHQYQMANSAAQTEKIVALQGGEDKLTDVLSRRVRSLLAIMMIGTWCFIVTWVVVRDPYMHFRVMVDTIPGPLFGWFSNPAPKTTLNVSAGSLLWNFVNLVELVSGYYFTKVGKSR
jgi:hypothetical protein